MYTSLNLDLNDSETWDVGRGTWDMGHGTCRHGTDTQTRQRHVEGDGQVKSSNEHQL